MANAMMAQYRADGIIDSYASLCGGTESESATETRGPMDEYFDRLRAQAAMRRWMQPKDWGREDTPIELSCAETVCVASEEAEVVARKAVCSQPAAAADPTGSDDAESSEPFDA